MNLRKLQPTDDRAEQIRIGKEIYETYDQDMVDFIQGSFDRIHDWDKKLPVNKEDLVYMSVYDYWVYGFIPEQEIYYRLYEKKHEEKSSYLSYNTKFLYFARLNKREDMHILEDKYEAYELLAPYYKREVIKIENEEDYPKFLDYISRHPVFVSKPLGLSCAMGVQKINSADYQDKRALFDSLVNVGLKYVGDFSIKESNHNGAVLEELIIQDEEFAKIHPDSVNGIRVTTVRVNGDVHIYYPWIKVGVNHDFIASAASGGFDAGIDSETGIVNTNGYLEDGSYIEYHPDTNVKIKGYVIPRWSELVSMAKEVALSLKESINYVGWDFVLTPNGWVIMEGNFYGDTMWQMFLEKGMRADFEELIGWKPTKKFWWQYNYKKL